MQSDKQRMMKLAGRYSALGIEIAAAIGIGALGGNWLDEKLQSSPWGLFAGMVVGIGAAVQAIRRTVIAYRKSLRETDDKLP